MDLAWWTAISEIARNFGIIVAGGLGLWFAWVRVRAADRQAEAAAEQSVLARRDHVAELFNRAVGHLMDECLEVRLGAVYTLEQIATDFRVLAGAVFELLNTYIREREQTYGSANPPPDIQIIIAMLRDEMNRQKGTRR